MPEDTPPLTGEIRAVMSATGRKHHGGSKLLAAAIERAMSDAVLKALQDGVAITNSGEILRRKQEARQGILNVYYGRLSEDESL